MKAILTKYVGPSNVRGSRIIATSGAGRTVTSYYSSLNSEENHAAAAKSHAEKFGWFGAMIGGGTGTRNKDTGYAFVFADSQPRFIVLSKATRALAGKKHKSVKEHFKHSKCPECGSKSEPAESVPDQSFRVCSNEKCRHDWIEDLSDA